jgi:hypothetical protein
VVVWECVCSVVLKSLSTKDYYYVCVCMNACVCVCVRVCDVVMMLHNEKAKHAPAMRAKNSR